MDDRYFKKIIGEKCYLSPMSLDDAAQYAEWLNETAVGLPLLQISEVLNLEKEKDLLKNLSTGYNFAIVDKDKDKLIGSVGLFHVDHIHGRAEMGIMIGDRNFWNRGYGTEATQLLLDYSFNALNLCHIRLGVFSFNPRALRCYEKVGFKVVGKFTEYIQIAGTRHDMILMEILAKDFESVYLKRALENVMEDKPSSNLELL